MTEFLNSIHPSAIANGLVILALEDADPARDMLDAPALSDPDRHILRTWYHTLPDVALAPYAADYADHLRRLLGRWSEDTGRAVLIWAAAHGGLHDPRATDRDDWPDLAFKAWWMALRTAANEDILGYFDATEPQIRQLAKLIETRIETLQKAEEDAAPFSPFWDPWDAEQIAYNRRFKSEFDLWFYDHVFLPQSLHLGEEVVRRITQRETRRFILDYAAQMPEPLRTQIATDLPHLMPGAGPYAIHPWQLDRLETWRAQPPDQLVPYAQVPDLWPMLTG